VASGGVTDPVTATADAAAVVRRANGGPQVDVDLASVVAAMSMSNHVQNQRERVEASDVDFLPVLDRVRAATSPEQLGGVAPPSVLKIFLAP
jgi:hypothetical protein